MVGITAELPGINEKNVERYDCSEWLPISISPPEGEDLEICVIDYDEIVVSLVYPCHYFKRRIGCVWAKYPSFLAPLLCGRSCSCRRWLGLMIC